MNGTYIVTDARQWLSDSVCNYHWYVTQSVTKKWLTYNGTKRKFTDINIELHCIIKVYDKGSSL